MIVWILFGASKNQCNWINELLIWRFVWSLNYDDTAGRYVKINWIRDDTAYITTGDRIHRNSCKIVEGSDIFTPYSCWDPPRFFQLLPWNIFHEFLLRFLQRHFHILIIRMKETRGVTVTMTSQIKDHPMRQSRQTNRTQWRQSIDIWMASTRQRFSHPPAGTTHLVPFKFQSALPSHPLSVHPHPACFQRNSNASWTHVVIISTTKQAWFSSNKHRINPF